MYDFKDVKYVHVEPTELCQAGCPMCIRFKGNGELNRNLTNASLSLEQVKNIFPPEKLENIDSFLFCGNFGDPALTPDLLEICEYLYPHVSWINVITNGGVRKPEWWAKLAKVTTKVTFSVDGLEDTNHIYRVGVVWEKVEENMFAYNAAGGYSDWTFLVFKHNQHQVEEARRMSELLGCATFTPKKSARWIIGEDVVKVRNNVTKKKNHLIYPPTDENWINDGVKQVNKAKEDYGSLENMYMNIPIKPKCLDKSKIYLGATGLVAPCCWIAAGIFDRVKKAEETVIGKVLHKQFGGLDSLNANLHPIENIIEGDFFKYIEDGWTNPCTRFATCGKNCGAKYNAHDAQWD